MKVLFVGPNLGAGGAERVWASVTAGLRDRGVDARIIALDGSGPLAAVLERSGVPFEVAHMRNRADIGRLRHSPCLRSFHPDVVVARGVSGLYVGYAVSRWRKAALVYNEHKQIGLELSARRERMLRYMCPRIDMVVAVAERQRDEWVARGSQRRNTVVVRNGVAANVAFDKDRSVRRELAVHPSAIVVLFAARLRPEKCALDFVTAVEEAHAVEPRILGLLAGDGPERDAVQAATAKSVAVRMLGHRDDIPRLLTCSDMLVLTSAYEALPMVILEAMAAGVPVIASRVGDVGQAVSDGETGILFTPGETGALTDALLLLAQDGALRGQLGVMARERHAELWDVTQMIDGYTDVLERLAVSRNRRAVSM
jgi:glycosyltransferase involved in cell wall biosynthesis